MISRRRSSAAKRRWREIESIMERHPEGEGINRWREKRGKHVSVVVCVTTCVCLCMSAAACNACATAYIYAWVCVCLCVQHGGWVWWVQKELFIAAASPSCKQCVYEEPRGIMGAPADTPPSPAVFIYSSSLCAKLNVNKLPNMPSNS